jgi:hypothetical protein
MMANELTSSMDLLLHCQNFDYGTKPENVALLYLGLQLIHSNASREDINASDLNGAFWRLREGLTKGSIRLIEHNVFSATLTRLKSVEHVIVIPNTTTFNSSSKLQTQAMAEVGWRTLEGSLELGDVIQVDSLKKDQFSSVAHMICRLPGDPTPRNLSSCLLKLKQTNSLCEFLVPLFGTLADVGIWRDALAVWYAKHRSSSFSGAFLTVCFSNDTKELAAALKGEMASLGIEL